MLPLQHTKQTYIIQILNISFTFSVFGWTLPSLPYLLTNFDQINFSLIETQLKVRHERRKVIDFLDTLYTPGKEMDYIAKMR